MKKKWILSDPYFLISALHHRLPRSGLDCDPLWKELAITKLDWSLAPSPRSEERIARQNPYEPPLGFRLASLCPGLDRQVSSSCCCDSEPFQTLHLANPWIGCVRIGFPLLPGFLPLSLSQPQTPRPVFLDGTCDPGPPPSYCHLAVGSFRRDLPFWAALVCDRLVSGTFHPPSGVLFIFPSPY